MTGLGSKQSSLKRDADEGSVTLQIGDETYDRSLTRNMGYVEYGGNPYTDTPELADLFAFLLENNEAPQAVAGGDNLREIIMRPIDTARIDAEIEERKRERESVRKEIEQVEQLQRELPTLEEERRSKREQMEEYCEELDTIKKQLAELDMDIDERQTRKEELEGVFQRIRDAQSEYDDLEFDLKTERSTLEDLRSERGALEDTLSEIDDPDEDLASLEDRIGELRQEKKLLEEYTYVEKVGRSDTGHIDSAGES